MYFYYTVPFCEYQVSILNFYAQMCPDVIKLNLILMKITNALGISTNVFMDFDIETVSDGLSLILKMDEHTL